MEKVEKKLRDEANDFSKIEAGKMDVEVQPFNLRECVESALDLTAARAIEKGLDIAYLIDDDVPAGIRSDVTRLRQLLINLLSNAVKFTDQGEVVLTVSVDKEKSIYAPADKETRRQGNKLPVYLSTCLRFSVRDTGMGISPSHMPRLFQSFSQADSSTTRKFGGTGLGLAISKRLAEMMGGEMRAESEGIGHGSSFVFTILADPAQVAERKAERLGARHRAKRADHHRQRHPALHGLHIDGREGNYHGQRSQRQSRRRHRPRRHRRMVLGGESREKRAGARSRLQNSLRRRQQPGPRPSTGSRQDPSFAIFFPGKTGARTQRISILYDVGAVLPGFPFVVIITSKAKVESDGDSIVQMLRGIKRGLDFLSANQERVAAAVSKKHTSFGDAPTVRLVVNQFAKQYSIAISRDDIESLISATRIEAEAKKLGGPDKFFTRQFVTKVLGQNR